MEASEVLHVELKEKPLRREANTHTKARSYVKQLNYSAFLRIFQMETQEALWKVRILS